ncbi:MAG: NAD(P)/FAD-dependent oxidoreductase, partial [Chitinispirillia bacterium]
MMKKKYDIVIVGAGPAGLMACRNILFQDRSVSVALIEKEFFRNKHIICGEGVYKFPFHELLEPKKEWIRFVVPNLVLHSPNNTTVTYVEPTNVGYIIDRFLMQSDLLKHCSKKGAHCIRGKRVTHISPIDNDHLRTVNLNTGESIKARVVVDCSGVLNKFGINEDIICKPRNMEIGILAYLSNVNTDEKSIHMHIGSQIAPGGYGWIFPRSKDSVNIGIVVAHQFLRKCNVKMLLDRFIKRCYPKATVEKVMAKPIAVFTKEKALATDGLIKAGDAACLINPVKRSGITESMMSGKIAGQFALEMLFADNHIGIISACRGYEQIIFEKLSRRFNSLAKVVKTLSRIPDKDLDAGAEILKSIPCNELTMSRIF